MFIQGFEEYFTRVTDGKYIQVYNGIGMALKESYNRFFQRNGFYLEQRLDLGDDFVSVVGELLRFQGATPDCEREVVNRLREFIKLI